MNQFSEWTPEEKEELLHLISQNSEGSNQEYANRLTEKFNRRFTSHSVRSKRKRLNKKKTFDATGKCKTEEEYKESYEYSSDGTYKSEKPLWMTLDQMKDPEYLLRAHGFEPDAWELIYAKNNIWNTNDKIHGIQTLYGSKITVKPRTDNLSVESVRKAFQEIAEGYIRPLYVPTRYSDTGKLLEVSIADLHLGKLAWYGDSNDTYNFEIARDRYFHIINDVLTRTKGQDFEKILFVWSHDFFHYDTPAITTTAGTRQDSDLKWAQMYQIGTKMLTEGIDLLSQQSKVETMYVGANHDKQTSFYATEHLAAWFRNDPNVLVDTDPKIRKFVEYGNNLIQFSHGHAEGKRLGDQMPKDAWEAWGRTRFHEVHAGHFHIERVVTKDNGVIVRYLNSPSGTDEWHYENGYGGGKQAGQSFIWDKDNGLMNVIYTTVGEK